MLAALLLALPAVAIANGAHACALPLAPYDPHGAAAAVTAIVTEVRGRGLAATYSLRRTAIVRAQRGVPGLPGRLKIRMRDFVRGTCGAQSPALRKGERVVLYFRIDRGVYLPAAWKKL